LRQRQYVGYYRVSTPVQGYSGLSREAQHDAVRQFVRDEKGKLVAEFSEVRSGLKTAGPQLREALRTCRMRRAILVVAAIDRLLRRMALTTALMDSDIELAVADSPNASRVVLHIKAAWAEYESTRISERIKAALAEARKRGVKLGHTRPIEAMRAMSLLGRAETRALAKARSMVVAPIVWKLRADGKSSKAIAAELNWLNAPTPQGRKWHSTGVLRVLQRTAAEFPALAAAAAARPDHRVQQAKERAERIAPLVWELRMTGKSLPEVADELNRRGVRTCRGRKWRREKVRTALIRARDIPGAEAAAATAIERRRVLGVVWAWEAAPTVWSLRVAGMCYQKIAEELERRNIRTARGGRWRATEVKTVLEMTRRKFPESAEAVAAAGHKVWWPDRKERIDAAAPLIIELRNSGRSYAAIARELNGKNIVAAMDSGWGVKSIIRVVRLSVWASAALQAAA
jgi:DNA invertase Pin-like site-specific DNA recombinase